MSKTVYGHSLGCKVNEYETRALIGTFLKEGYEETLNPDNADLLILNTCAVTERAAQKSRQYIRRFRRLSPRGILVAMGCYTKEAGELCLSYGADIVLGTEARNKVFEDLQTFEKERKPIVDLSKKRSGPLFEELGAPLERHTRAYLKVQDGCDKFCSYCAIPFLRGGSRSRLPESVLYGAKDLLEKGAKEIVLSGVEIGFYGKDLKEGAPDLAGLLRLILTTFPELPRLRVSSLDASEITDSFLSVYREFPALMPHFHLSLQSGSKGVLERMKRRYEPKDYLKALEALRAIRPETAITTDIIVGYPEETEEEWEETLRFALEARFSEIHVFPYSARKGTASARLPEIPNNIKTMRARELLRLSKELRKEYEREFYGKELPILFESFDPKTGLLYGHSPNYLLVKTPGEPSKVGEIAPVIYQEESAAD